ncbi:ENTH/VHS/GAT family protein [Corchorus olitorius]|uniref:ENTH/VHS/GAT family protein n=1 Tax=Corchorus olitorius TaxID=93759 RepID=A0A1R3K0D2_9ROSI|nr:ENTH/VHS/GAT family protein [Corchorus olitorius]
MLLCNFPQRSERSAPVLTPPQTQPLSSYPPNVRDYDRQDAAESSAESEFPTLSLTEMQNARGIMDVLAEMLNALDLGNKEGLRQEVIVDLVEQCRTYKQRVVHILSTSSTDASSVPFKQLLLPAPLATNGSTPAAAVNPKLDLLSGDDYSSPKADGNNPSDSVNVQSFGLAGQTNPLTPQIQQQQNFYANRISGSFHSNNTASGESHNSVAMTPV